MMRRITNSFPEMTLRCAGDIETVKSATAGGDGGVPGPPPQAVHTATNTGTHLETILLFRPAA